MGTKVFIVGKQLVDYEDRKTGEAIKGYKVFFFCPSEGVKGYYAASVWVDAGRAKSVFDQVAAMTINEGDFLEAEFVYSVIPGRRTQQLISITLEA